MNDWRTATLGAYTDILTGHAFKSAHYSPAPGGLRLLRGDNIGQGELRWDNAKRWPRERSQGLEAYYPEPGDVVVAMDRTWVNAGLKYAVVRSTDLPCLLVQRVARLRTKEGLLAQFLPYVIDSNAFVHYVKRVQTETAIPHISAAQLRDFSFPLPPIDEQARIAALLDKWSNMIDLTAQLLAHKKTYRENLAESLLSGKKRIPRYQTPWHEMRLGDVLRESRLPGHDGRTARKLTVRLYGKGVYEKTDKRTGSENTKYYIRRAGQLIYSKLDFLNGAFGLIPAHLDGYESTLDLPCFDIGSALDPDYLRYYVSRESFYAKFRGGAVGGRKARRVSPDEFLAAHIPVPEPPEQRAIVRILTLADREIGLLTDYLEALKQQRRGLIQQLLTGKRRLKVTEAA